MNENQTVWVVLGVVFKFGSYETSVLGVFTSERRAEQEREAFEEANQNAYAYASETHLNTEN